VILKVFEDNSKLARAAAERAADAIRRAINARGGARIVVATGSSQFEFLDVLTAMQGIGWDQVEMFHLDEYIGLPATHPGSFQRYLQERLISKVGLKHFHLLDGEAEPSAAIAKVGEALRSGPIDVAFAGIGENGHLAFNDPPADFETEEPYLVVELSKASRQQQFREGWFPSLEDVPRHAITMSVRQILKANEIVCIAQDQRKAKAVKMCFEGRISHLFPASILRTHGDTTVYLNKQSASLLNTDALAGDVTGLGLRP
jgi:glucosamine-6-phosphate deaminase